MSGEIKRGDPVRLSHLPVISTPLPTGACFAGTVKPNKKGRVFVVLLLGEEGKDGSDPLDPAAVLNEMGWFYREEAPQ